VACKATEAPQALARWRLSLSGRVFATRRVIASDLQVPKGPPSCLRGQPPNSLFIDFFKQKLEEACMRLPSEPVRVGAKLRCVTSFESERLIVERDATYTLESIAADTIQVVAFAELADDRRAVAASCARRTTTLEQSRPTMETKVSSPVSSSLRILV
jgi:hypothetical protein